MANSGFPSKDFKWPEAASSDPDVAYAERGWEQALAEVDKLRQDRDELLTELERIMARIDACDAQLCECVREPNWPRVEALVARVKAGKP